MRIGIVANEAEHQQVHAQALSEGFGAHQIETTVYPERVQPAEQLVACWGWRIGAALHKLGKEVLVLERGFVNRAQYTSFGWNGINGRARRGWATVPGRTVGMRPWRPDGLYVLLCGQVEGDAAIAHVDIRAWYDEAARALQKFGLPILFRPHPQAVQFGQDITVRGAETFCSTLADSLDGAALVVTFNSNTGVDALLSGKPTIARDQGSMAWGVASHDWRIQDKPDRKAWAEHLAACQFSLDEIRSGYAWSVVKDSQPHH